MGFSGSDGLGVLACALVLCIFATAAMGPLRPVAMASDAAFIGYGWSLGLWPVLALHALPLPLNAFRLARVGAGHRRLSSAGCSPRG